MNKNKIQLRITSRNSRRTGKRPENRNELDSRKDLEQDFQGDDITHKEKTHRHNFKK